MEKRNNDIRTLARVEGLRHWQIAEVLGVSDITFSRWLRKELSPEKKEEIRNAIKVAKLKESEK